MKLKALVTKEYLGITKGNTYEIVHSYTPNKFSSYGTLYRFINDHGITMNQYNCDKGVTIELIKEPN